MQSNIGGYLDANDDINQHVVIVVHGKLSKIENGRYSQLFLNTEHPYDNIIPVLCATRGVGNVGLDSPHIRNVYQMELPPPPLDFLQEIGRAGRVLPLYLINYSHMLYFCIKIFLYISTRSMNPDDTYNGERFSRKGLTTCLILQ